MADELQAGRRYQAARAAAGQGEDAAPLDEPEQARRRQQALDWLRADLALWARPLEDNAPKGAAVQKALQGWQSDTALAVLRDSATLVRFDKMDCEACRKLWADVEELLAQLQLR